MSAPAGDIQVNLALSKINLPSTISLLNIKEIDLDTLFSGISSLPNTDSSSTPDKLVPHYNNIIFIISWTILPDSKPDLSLLPAPHHGSRLLSDDSDPKDANLNASTIRLVSLGNVSQPYSPLQGLHLTS